MAGNDGAERTEPATPKRREDARRRGEVAQSRDVTSVVILAAGLALAISPLGRGLVTELGGQARALWGGAVSPPGSLNDAHALILGLGAGLLRHALPLAGLLVVAAAGASFAQVGPLLSAEALAFRPERLDPVKGLGRLVSPERLFDLAKAMFKLVAVSTVAVVVIVASFDTVIGLIDAAPDAAASELESLAVRLAGALIAVLAVLSVADWVWTRFQHERKLRMTRQEVRDELRQREGSPEVRSRLRTLQRELSRQRMIAAVAEADVVVRNPTHYAVALRYVRAEMEAPRVVAKGRARVAERILAAARAHDVPVVENAPLARLLYRTARLGRQVPEALYQAVAEVLAAVYRLDRRRAAAWRSAP